MDRTLKRATRKNKRRSNRNHAAWRRFAPDGNICRFCPHHGGQHLISSGQPHLYRKATEEERDDSSTMLYRLHTPDNGYVLVRRMVVANRAELISAFCAACAEEIGTAQVLCYQRTLAVGEVVGVQTGRKNIGIAA